MRAGIVTTPSRVWVSVVVMGGYRF